MEDVGPRRRAWIDILLKPNKFRLASSLFRQAPNWESCPRYLDPWCHQAIESHVSDPGTYLRVILVFISAMTKYLIRSNVREEQFVELTVVMAVGEAAAYISSAVFWSKVWAGRRTRFRDPLLPRSHSLTKQELSAGDPVFKDTSYGRHVTFKPQYFSKNKKMTDLWHLWGFNLMW